MRALVAGAAGFIGFHLSERLLAEGYEVIGLDDLSTGQARNAHDLAKREGFTFLRQDVTRAFDVAAKLDVVYNLACPASPVDFHARALEILSVCSTGVLNLLGLARQHGARLVHASTSEVYGDPLEHPQRESYRGNVNPIGPRACYDEGKRFAEALIVNYSRVHSVPARLARIFNTYGPRMRDDDGRVLPNFIRQAQAGEPLTVHGDGLQTRSFCFVSDLVDGLFRLANSAVEGPVNIGNPMEVTILDFAREVIRLTGSRSAIRHVAANAEDPKVRRPDITRAQSLLGWSARVERAEGVARTVDWFRSDAAGAH